MASFFLTPRLYGGLVRPSQKRGRKKTDPQAGFFRKLITSKQQRKQPTKQPKRRSKQQQQRPRRQEQQRQQQERLELELVLAQQLLELEQQALLLFSSKQPEQQPAGR